MNASALNALGSAYVAILGTAQDGGFPQPGCTLGCCQTADSGQRGGTRFVACLGIVDPDTSQRWLIDCTPDFPRQLELLNQIDIRQQSLTPQAILLTHAHVGHYTGLIHLGREIMCTENLAVHAMPRMARFLADNDPWRQLIRQRNIEVLTLNNRQPVWLNDRICVTPVLVPHRDEFSETVGFLIRGPHRKVLYIPDIDAWEQMRTPIEQLIDDVDVALLDGTFFDNTELPHREMSGIAHPTIFESMVRFDRQPARIRERIRFIHFNHTNPALREGSPARRKICANGYQVARERDQILI